MPTRPLVTFVLSSRARVLRASAAALGCLLSLACSDSLTFERKHEMVLIPDSYSTCREGDVCTLTGADCSGCCGVAAVRADVEQDVYVAVQRTCQTYDGDHCDSCSALTRPALCIDGRCTLVHSATCTTTVAKLGTAVTPGTGGIKDPFSCNDCTCQSDGTLACDNRACGVPCSAGMAPGTTCDGCGFNTNCDTLRTACLPSCTSTADCGGTRGGVCADGVCKRLCGKQ